MSSFVAADGAEIAYEVLGEGEAVVLHHGFASNAATNFVRPGVARAVVDSGRSAVLIDARGHGASSKPHDPRAYAGGAMVDDVRRLLDVLRLERAHFVGYSMGAFVGMRLAVVDGRLRSLVLGGVGLGQMTRNRPEVAERIAEALETAHPELVAEARARSFRTFADATKADRLALAALQRSGSLVPPLQVLAAIAVPTLVLNGTGDTLAGPPGLLAEAILGARAESVPGDHLSAVVHPEFGQAIVNFLDSLAAHGW